MFHINFCDFIAGWISGVCGLAVGHPADTVKIRHQTFRDSGTLKIAYQTLKHEGVRGFYRGLGFPLLTAGALNSIFFGVYGNCLSHIQQSRGYENTRRTSSEGGVCNKHWHLDVWLAGSVAGFVQLSLACPVDLVKIKLQTQTGKTWGNNPELGYRGPLECLSSTYRDYGVRGLYRGLPVMMWRDVIASSVYMSVYNGCIEGQPGSKNLFMIMMAGGFAGIISWGVIIPLDVIKSRIQSDDPLNPKYKGMLDCFVKSYRRDGLAVFGRGFLVNTLRAFPVNGAIFVGFEWSYGMCKNIGEGLSLQN